MTKDELLDALQRLGELIPQKAQIVIAGGAALTRNMEAPRLCLGVGVRLKQVTVFLGAVPEDPFGDHSGAFRTAYHQRLIPELSA
jgi:hypothetical protein